MKNKQNKTKKKQNKTKQEKNNFYFQQISSWAQKRYY